MSRVITSTRCAPIAAQQAVHEYATYNDYRPNAIVGKEITTNEIESFFDGKQYKRKQTFYRFKSLIFIDRRLQLIKLLPY